MDSLQESPQFLPEPSLGYPGAAYGLYSCDFIDEALLPTLAVVSTTTAISTASAVAEEHRLQASSSSADDVLGDPITGLAGDWGRSDFLGTRSEVDQVCASGDSLAFAIAKACSNSEAPVAQVEHQNVQLEQPVEVSNPEPQTATLMRSEESRNSVTTVMAPDAKIYNTGDELSFEFRFDRPVCVTGYPAVNLKIGSTIRPAIYTTGSGTTQLTFKHIISTGENDENGISIKRAINLPSGASLLDTAGQPVSLTFKAPDTKKLLVDTNNPTITLATVPNTDPLANRSSQSFSVRFSEKVRVKGVPTLPIAIGQRAMQLPMSGRDDGGKSLLFKVPFQEGEALPKNVRLAGPIRLPAGAAIRDLAGNDATLSSTRLFPTLMDDSVGPSVISFGQPVIDDKSRKVSLAVTFNESVKVEGKPSIPFSFAGRIRRLVYASGAGESVLMFSFKPTNGMLPVASALVVPKQTISAKRGAITDASGNVAVSLSKPSAPLLSVSRIAEKRPAGSRIGIFSTIDADASSDRYTYTLIPGTGSKNNSLFKIVGRVLKTLQPLDYEAKSNYTVRVRSTDSGGLSAEKAFKIRLIDVNDCAPVFTSNESGFVTTDTPIEAGIYTAVVSDGDGTQANRAVTFSLMDDGDKALLNIDATTGLVSLKQKASINAKNNYSFTVRATNVTEPSLSSEQAVTISLIPAADLIPPRVMGAISTGNSSVMIAFSEAMDDNILNSQNFSISPTNVNAEAGILAVTSVSFANADRTAVTLTTGVQNELNYTIRVLGGTDSANNSFAAPSVVGVDPTKTTFNGTPPTVDLLQDSDSDGLTDNDEGRGWTVVVKEINGTLSRRQVTSSPLLDDTDGDGVLDGLEAALRTDPRDADTDDDQLTDYQEYYEIFCDHLNQDTDGDGVDDGTEFLGVTSNPNFADTDGDQFDDAYEIATALRNPLEADVPQVSIRIGDIDLQLDVRFTETNSTETSLLEARSVNSTLSQTDNESFSHTNTTSHEFAWGFAEKANFSYSTQADSAGIKFDLSFEATQNTTDTTTTENSSASSKETQKAYEDSLSSEQQANQGSSVSREVAGATMKVAISLRNLSSTVAYTVNNLQITAFIQDPRNVTRLKPIATLLPDSEPEGGIAMGPLVLERGPFIFSNDTIYPKLVEDLMKNPRALVFRISNYDLIDESGRKFAFASTDLAERTAALVIDYGGADGNGDGQGDATEYHRVSTSPGRIAIDTNGDGTVDENDRRVAFDLPGVHVGTTLRQLFSSMRMNHYYEYIDPDHQAKLQAKGISETDIKDSESLTLSELRKSYSTYIDANGIEQLFRVRNVSTESLDAPEAWFVITGDGVDRSKGIDQYIVNTNESITLAFVRDNENDGVSATAEFTAGTSDNLKDTDGDGLDDRFEAFRGWDVTVVGEGTRHVYARGDSTDSDGDGLTDLDEAPGLLTYDDRGLITQARQEDMNDFITDPMNSDTDFDGVSDSDELSGYSVTLKYPEGGPAEIVVFTSPLNPDSDGDGVFDGMELDLGLNPQVSDASKYRDTDQDGLVDFEEELGWEVTTYGASTLLGEQGVSTTYTVTSLTSRKDSDSDGLSDKEEKDLGTDPKNTDTDGDGLSDLSEVNLSIFAGVRTISLKYNPLDADVDNDNRPDGAELNTPWTVSVDGSTPYQIFSDPKRADQDNDGWADSEELTKGTDPTRFDTDGDNASIGDRREFELSTNPLKEDKRVQVIVEQIKFDGDATGEDIVEPYGSFEMFLNLPEYRRFTTQYVEVSDQGGQYDLRGRQFNQTATISKTQSVFLKNYGLGEYDEGSGDDVILDAQVEVLYASIFDNLTVDVTSNASDVGRGCTLTTTFRLRVLT